MRAEPEEFYIAKRSLQCADLRSMFDHNESGFYGYQSF